MAYPRAFEVGVGSIYVLTPDKETFLQYRHGVISIEEYRIACFVHWGPLFQYMAPGTLQPSPPLLISEKPLLVEAGDTLCCACGVDKARQGLCTAPGWPRSSPQPDGLSSSTASSGPLLRGTRRVKSATRGSCPRPLRLRASSPRTSSPRTSRTPMRPKPSDIEVGTVFLSKTGLAARMVVRVVRLEVSYLPYRRKSFQDPWKPTKIGVSPGLSVGKVMPYGLCDWSSGVLQGELPDSMKKALEPYLSPASPPGVSPP